jgi:heme exporter protein C
LSVYLFRTLHPQPIVLKPSAPSLPPEMLTTLLVSTLVFTALYLGFVTTRYGLAVADEAREEAGDAA